MTTSHALGTTSYVINDEYEELIGRRKFFFYLSFYRKLIF